LLIQQFLVFFLGSFEESLDFIGIFLRTKDFIGVASAPLLGMSKMAGEKRHGSHQNQPIAAIDGESARS